MNPSTVELPLSLVTDVLTYLSTKPYNEVTVMINTIGPFYQQAMQRQQAAQQRVVQPGANGNAALKDAALAS